MKHYIRIFCVVAAILGLKLPTLNAQAYSISWYKSAGGGGQSAGGIYQVTGTIGQTEAGGPMTGGGFSLTGGFWSLIGVVRTPGLPDLMVTHLGNSVIVSWPDTGNYTLLQNTVLNSGHWTTNTSLVSTVSGTNSINITPPKGNLFLRLSEH